MGLPPSDVRSSAWTGVLIHLSCLNAVHNRIPLLESNDLESIRMYINRPAFTEWYNATCIEPVILTLDHPWFDAFIRQAWTTDRVGTTLRRGGHRFPYPLGLSRPLGPWASRARACSLGTVARWDASPGVLRAGAGMLDAWTVQAEWKI